MHLIPPILALNVASLDSMCSRVRQARSSSDIRPSRCPGASRHTEIELLSVHLWKEGLLASALHNGPALAYRLLSSALPELAKDPLLV